MPDELKYGLVFVEKGRYKWRIIYYDDDETKKTAICYLGHPLDFAETVDIPLRFLREPNIDDLMDRHSYLWSMLGRIACNEIYEIDPEELHSLWSERFMIFSEIANRRILGAMDQLSSKPNVFLCHCSSDKITVRMIHDDLKNLGANVWIDENKIKVGDSIVSKISDGLSESRTMIVFLSPESVSSIWVSREWQSFLARKLSGTDLRILPALLKKCTIPSIISDIKYANFTEDYRSGLREIYDAIK